MSDDLLRGAYVNRTTQLLAGGVVWLMGLGVAQAAYQLNLTEGVTDVSHDVYQLHMLIFWICVAIGVGVFGVMFYSIYHHRKSRGAVAAQFHESTRVEILWTVIPFFILLAMAIPATKTLVEMEDVRNADLSIKVTGYQWKWRYTYIGEDIDFFSSLDAQSNQARQLRSKIDPKTIDNYLLEVDKPLVIPIGKKVRFLFTGADVIHSWWVPDFGWKKDAIPGFINEAWTLVKKPGVYRGQCTELCGRDHGFMPIVVKAVPEEEYQAWLASFPRKVALKEMTKQELMTKGAEVYNTSCAACHQVNGEGIAGVFPPIKASPVALGPAAEHIDMVVKGKGMMPGFADALNLVELAAVITYERNAFGNNTGDLVQPTQLAAEQSFTLAELVEKGEGIYNEHCAACHQADGKGIAGVFPAIADSALVKGLAAEHAKVVLQGKNVMPAFSSTLSDEELAAVITYQRNAFGNNVGDAVQPKDVRSYR